MAENFLLTREIGVDGLMEHRSIDKTRNDCVDTNTIGGDIARKALGQAEQCALGGAVNTDLGQTDDRGLGGDEHYAAVLLLTHVRDGGLTERKRRKDERP